MNILFVNEYASPNIVSGAEYSMHALAEGLNKQPKTKVIILSPGLSANTAKIKEIKGVTNLKFPWFKKVKAGQVLSPLWFNNPIFWIYSAMFISECVKDYDIDLIHVHGKYILPGAIIVGKLRKIPVVTTVRDFKFLCPLALCFTNQKKQCSFLNYLSQEIPEYLERYIKKTDLVSKLFLGFRLILAKIWQYLLKFFLNQSQKVIAVSPQLSRIYQQAGVNDVVAVYNLPPRKFPLLSKEKVKALRNKYGLQDKKIILSVGKLSYGKGTDILLKVMKILGRDMPSARLILAGTRNISLKIPFPKNSVYLGQLPHQQILDLYRLVDVFVILSRWPEPLSRAALEALAAGLPIIASDRGGNREVVRDDFNGFMVDLENPKAVAKVLIDILSHPGKIKRFSSGSYQLYSDKFSRQRVIRKHLDLYQSIG